MLDDDAFQPLWPRRLICTPCAVNSFIVRRVIDLSKDAPADLAQQMFYFILSHCVCMKGGDVEYKLSAVHIPHLRGKQRLLLNPPFSAHLLVAW